jgi:hypothetical protein
MPPRKSLNLHGIRLLHPWEPATLYTSDRLPTVDLEMRRSERAKMRQAMVMMFSSRAEACPACQKKAHWARSVHQVQGPKALHQTHHQDLVLSGRIVRGVRGLQEHLLFLMESRVVICPSAHPQTGRQLLRTSTSHLVLAAHLQCLRHKHVSREALVIDRLHLPREWVDSCRAP